VEAASLLGIPSSGTTGGVDNGVTVAIFSGPSWVVNGTNSNLNSNARPWSRVPWTASARVWGAHRPRLRNG